MKRLQLFVTVALLLLSTGISAQRRGRQPVKPKVEVPPEDPRITQMLSSVQQVVFIDSIVVGKEEFMRFIPLSQFSGKLMQEDSLGIFTNEMGDHRLSTVSTAVGPAIVSSDFIANRWTEAQPLEGIGTEPSANPFLMPDGTTLYFAQKGEKSIGGYDIFVTRYNGEKGTFLKPENLGMPFASEANDYFYAIDEFNQLGYFVTDRRQPSGKVCVYIFIPQNTRHAYRADAYGDEQLRQLAAVSRIADTWGDGKERGQALNRLQAARQAQHKSLALKQSPLQSELDTLRYQAEVLEKALQLTRNYYATASDNERQRLRPEILGSERQLEKLQMEIRNREKQIPYTNN